MGPPPPKNPSFSNSNSSFEDTSNPSTTPTTKKPMGPPPPKFATPPPPLPPEPDSIHNEETKTSITDEIATNLDNTHVVESKLEEHHHHQQQQQQEETLQEPKPKPKPKSIPDSITKESPSITIPYSIPPWSEAPCHPFSLEVLKDGSIIDEFEVSEKGAYMFGRVDLCDFVLDHPTISRFHAASGLVVKISNFSIRFMELCGITYQHGLNLTLAELNNEKYGESVPVQY
ncbi:SMAD/FHA domain-containing protein [Thalictrum thalictroides]|uniref:SMAD/FHA domain-containing protein n=1 Tax=Thalictrum thalictroides TaxID=46969 RepID=A0A7J6W1I0_THATH|nr:SMAD/FHA domain-containing protein [Thalictrum thalictroides]